MTEDSPDWVPDSESKERDETKTNEQERGNGEGHVREDGAQAALSVVDVLEQVGEGELIEPDVVVHESKSLVDVGRGDVLGQPLEVPCVVDDVGGDLHGGVSDDVMISQLGGTSGLDFDFLDSSDEMEVAVLDAFFARRSPAGGEDGARLGGVDQVFLVSKMNDCFIVRSDFHSASGKGVFPVLSIESPEAGGAQVSSEDAVSLADEEAVVVLAVHQVGVLDLDGEAVESSGESNDVVFWFGQESDISVHQGKRVQSVEVEESSLGNHGHVEKKRSLLSVKDVRQLQLEQVGRLVGNQRSFLSGGMGLDFLEEGLEVFWLEEVDGESPELSHLEGVAGDLKAAADVVFHHAEVGQGESRVLDGHHLEVGGQVLDGVLDFGDLERVLVGDVDEMSGPLIEIRD